MLSLVKNKMYNKIISDLKIIENDGFDECWAKLQDVCKIKPTATLSYNEAKLGWNIIQKYKPSAFVELGVQFGHSSIIWIDALRKYGGLYIGVELGKDKDNNYPDAGIGNMQFLPDSEDVVKIWGDAVKVLPNLFSTYDIEMAFHDAAHTWDHVHKCVSISKEHNTIQLCHDCKPAGSGDGSWNRNITTPYGVIWAERPVFEELLDDGYLEFFIEDYGLGVYVPEDKL